MLRNRHVYHAEDVTPGWETWILHTRAHNAHVHGCNVQEETCDLVSSAVMLNDGAKCAYLNLGMMSCLHLYEVSGVQVSLADFAHLTGNITKRRS